MTCASKSPNDHEIFPTSSFVLAYAKLSRGNIFRKDILPVDVKKLCDLSSNEIKFISFNTISFMPAWKGAKIMAVIVFEIKFARYKHASKRWTCEDPTSFIFFALEEQLR